MSDIQPLVNIQVAAGDFSPAPSGIQPYLPAQMPLSFGAGPMGSMRPPFCADTEPGASTQEYQAITNQFITAINQILASFRSLIEGLLNRLQAPAGTGSTGTGASAPAGTASGTSSSAPASNGSTSSAPVGPSTGSSSGTTAPANTTPAATPSTTPSTSGTAAPAATPSGTPASTTSSTTGASGAGTSTGASSAAGSAKPLGKTGQFLWKPKADKDGRLVVLLPKKLGRVKSVHILSADGKTTLATGRYSGFGNGDRAHYRFSKPGTEFPKGAIVEIIPQKGTPFRVTIPDPSKRFTY